MLKISCVGLGLLILAGCSSYGVVKNQEKVESPEKPPYSIKLAVKNNTGDINLVLAFSGGGTRAAALSYGVMQELRDTSVMVDGERRRLLDEVDVISSVSGGSFTSAYYGLHGDNLFEDFERVFLKRNVQSKLLQGMFNPLQWFNRAGRTEMAIRIYDRQIFHDATFADMRDSGGPLILINASDLSYGIRFSFVQEYFDLLCSDIDTFPVSRAVAASSAVPVLFNPVVVKNHPGCELERAEFAKLVRRQASGNAEWVHVVDGLMTYRDKKKRQYAHFVDGGITDNLGLRAIYQIIEGQGDAAKFLEYHGRDPARWAVAIVVDASTDPERVMDQTRRNPSLEETISTMSSAQLHLYNAATLELMDRTITKWAQETSTPELTVQPYFIKIGFRDLEHPETREYFNGVPTSFALSDEQVDRLIAAGRELLRSNPEYQRLLASLQGQGVAGK